MKRDPVDELTAVMRAFGLRFPEAVDHLAKDGKPLSLGPTVVAGPDRWWTRRK